MKVPASWKNIQNLGSAIWDNIEQLLSQAPLGAGKQAQLMAISKVPSFNYTNSKRSRVAGFTSVQTLDNAIEAAQKTTFNVQPAYLLDQSTQPKSRN